jgi:hypothetical protein
MTKKPDFDYSLVSYTQKIALQTLSKLLGFRSLSTTEDVLVLGADLMSAWRVLGKDDDLLMLWCDSKECPLPARHAKMIIWAYQRTPEGKIGRGFFNERMLADVAYNALNSDFRLRKHD